MFVAFDSLGDSSRVWVFQASRKFSAEEVSTISQALHAFTQQWAAHNQPLMSSYKIYHDQFIVLAADENYNEASGCSIDTATRVFQQLDSQFALGLFDRTNIAFYVNDMIQIVSLADVAKKHQEGFWNQDTLMFNNVIQTKNELNSKWLVPAQQTWLKRYLKNAVV